MKEKYSFICAENDVDFQRIIDEAPEKTPFILVEERERRRSNTSFSTLMIHTDVLSNVKGRMLGTQVLGPNWGYNEGVNPNDTNVNFKAYRYFVFDGKIPGEVKQQIEGLRRDLNPKNWKTEVTYL